MSPESTGLTLDASLRSSVIRGNLGSAGGGRGKASLDETRSYYGLSSVTTSVDGAIRGSSHQRSTSTSSLHSSGLAGKVSSEWQTQEMDGPVRNRRVLSSHAASLPPPKAFLSPKKPLQLFIVPSRSPTLDREINADTNRNDTAGHPLPGAVTPAQGRRQDYDANLEQLVEDDKIARVSDESSASLGDNSYRRCEGQSFSTQRSLKLDRRPSGTQGGIEKGKSRANGLPRKYQTLPPSGISFFLQGRLMTGGDSVLPLLGSLALICGVGGCWLGTTGVWLWRHRVRYGLGSAGIAIDVIFGYLLLSTLSSMAGAAFRDPGILPRDLDLHPPVFNVASTESLVPLPRELRVRDASVTVKYCETCKIYRPPRSSHCRLCGNCVDGIDHHCTYLHTCIGKRNYVSFLAFVIWTSNATIYEVVFSALHFFLVCSRDQMSFKDALARSPGAAVSFAMGIVVVWPVLALLGYHLRLMFLNSTTIEQIRFNGGKTSGQSQKSANPFSYPTVFRNLLAASLGRPRLPSWLDARGVVGQDTRSVNPGLAIERL